MMEGAVMIADCGDAYKEEVPPRLLLSSPTLH